MKYVIGMDVVETSLGERTWYEIMGAGEREDNYGMKIDRLERTAAVAAKAIECFLEEKFR
ncbi:MAG: hypothetical protein ABIG39_01500 [Candidatus Micrarchaeota archaeon]